MDHSMTSGGQHATRVAVSTGPTNAASGGYRTAGQAIPISTLLSDSADAGETQPSHEPAGQLAYGGATYHHQYEQTPSTGRYIQPQTTNGALPAVSYNHAPQLPTSLTYQGFTPIQALPRPQYPTIQQPQLPPPPSNPPQSQVTGPPDPQPRYPDRVRQPPAFPNPQTLHPPPGPRRRIPAPAPEPELTYRLLIRQQPEAARACGFGERDRRVVDPPPIIEVRAVHASGEEQPVRDSYTTVHAVLLDGDTRADASQMAMASGQQAQRLMGCGVVSPFVGDDERGACGSFFVFSDLSVRQAGSYRLKFRLLRVDPNRIPVDGRCPILGEVESERFEVYTAKEFPGMKASSALIKALRRQGLNVGVKKGRDAGRRRSNVDDDESEEDEDESSSESESTRGKGKGKARHRKVRR